MVAFCRFIGWLLIFAALFCFGYEVMAWRETGHYQVIALGQIIYDYMPSLLPYLQAGVQRHLHPAIWDPGIETILLWPGWADFGVPGVILLLLCRYRRRSI
jgi:hypothetical protein